MLFIYMGWDGMGEFVGYIIFSTGCGSSVFVFSDSVVVLLPRLYINSCMLLEH